MVKLLLSALIFKSFLKKPKSLGVKETVNFEAKNKFNEQSVICRKCVYR